MKKVLLLALTIVLVSSQPAAAQQLFDFVGYALVPTTVGDDLAMYGVLTEYADTPLPLDYDNFEYTVVITGLTLDTDGAQQLYSGGAIAIYEDAGTAADYNNQATFVDGTAILSGVLQNLTRSITFPLSGMGNANGTVDWTGGSQIAEIAPSDQIGWNFVTGISGLTVEPGYDEQWDGKVEPQTPIVASEVQSMAAVKALY